MNGIESFLKSWVEFWHVRLGLGFVTRTMSKWGFDMILPTAIVRTCLLDEVLNEEKMAESFGAEVLNELVRTENIYRCQNNMNILSGASYSAIDKMRRFGPLHTSMWSELGGEIRFFPAASVVELFRGKSNVMLRIAQLHPFHGKRENNFSVGSSAALVLFGLLYEARLIGIAGAGESFSFRAQELSRIIDGVLGNEEVLSIKESGLNKFYMSAKERIAKTPSGRRAYELLAPYGVTPRSVWWRRIFCRGSIFFGKF